MGFSFIPAFTSKNSVVEGSKLIKYSGSGGFIFQRPDKPSGSINVEGDVAGYDNRVLAAGPVGFTAATEAPRLELTLGWPPATRSLPAISTLSLPMGLSPMAGPVPLPCQTNILAFSVNAGATYIRPTPSPLARPREHPSVSLWSKTIKSAGAGGLCVPAKSWHIGNRNSCIIVTHLPANAYGLTRQDRYGSDHGSRDMR